jgi:hypothetical protein
VSLVARGGEEADGGHGSNMLLAIIGVKGYMMSIITRISKMGKFKLITLVDKELLDAIDHWRAVQAVLEGTVVLARAAAVRALIQRGLEPQ